MRAFVFVTVLLALLTLSSCGGGAGSSSANPGPVQNSVPRVVDLGPVVGGAPVGALNQAYVTVTICNAGSATACQTIDHVWVDTGSIGLRLVASALNNLSLPGMTDSGAASGNPLAECYQFVSSYVWGAIRSADVRMGGEVAKSIPIQVIGDAAFPVVPPTCSSTGDSRQNTVGDLYANGLLGVGNFAQDCGDACTSGNVPAAYYACTSSGCQPANVPLARQVPNPVTAFAADNNGIALALPAVPAQGAATATGTLTFGIGTQANNALGSAAVLTVDPNSGYFTTLLGASGLPYPESFIDSGSNGLYFSDATNARLLTCAVNDFLYCPLNTLPVAATNIGANGLRSTVSFSVAAADALFQAQPNFAAFSNIAGPNPPLGSSSPSFDWGLPFFYGRTVFFAVEGAKTSGGAGPYVAYRSRAFEGRPTAAAVAGARRPRRWLPPARRRPRNRAGMRAGSRVDGQ